MNDVVLIEGVCIRRDAEGRFRLNDLHEAAGGEQRHQPRYWLANHQTQELLDVLTDSGNPLTVIKGGHSQGTYVCKELVYHYAMWISAAFNLAVIRAFDAMVSGRSEAVLDLNNPRDLRRKLLDFTERVIELEDRVEVLTPKAEVFDQTFNEKKRPTIAALVRKMAGVNSNATKRDLLMLGYLYRTGGTYRVRSEHRGVLFEEQFTDGYDNIVCLPRGVELLGRLYSTGQLTMKKSATKQALPALIH